MASTGRVAQACVRCRRQKLKCDTLRPCTLCVRARVECEPRRTPARSSTDRPASSRRDRTAEHPPPPPYQPETPTTVTSLPPLQPSGSTPDWQTQSLRNPQDHNELHSTQHKRREAADGPDASEHSPSENQQFGANTSVIDFARNVFRHNDLASPSITSTIPGDAGVFRQPGSRWGLQRMQMPPRSVMHLLVKAYFERVHWFIFVFHEPTFMARAETLLSSASWTRQDLPVAMTILTTAAIALKCILNDTSWPGHSILASYAMNAKSLLSDLIAEIRVHLLDLLDDSQIETVQVCLLLGTYYIYHGSPSSAWSILGMAVRTAYALALHCDDPEDEEKVETQVRHRCWNHVTVADTFSAMIYGRPACLDSAFSHVQPLCEMDDTFVAVSMGRHADGGHPASRPSKLTFHVLKYRLYSITKQALSNFRLLRLKDPLSPEDQNALIRAVSHIESLLAEWRKEVPPFLSVDCWHNVEPSGPFPPELGCLSGLEEDLARLFWLQATILQLTHDSTLIYIHRPMLEHKLVSYHQGGTVTPSQYCVSQSLETAVQAALRISRLPMAQYNHRLSLSFAFMHFFTAGVILCIPPAKQPFSLVAQEAKAGISRIILASRSLGSSSQIAQHIDQLLTALLRITILREMDNALHNQGSISGVAAQSTASFAKEAGSLHQDSTRPSSVDRGAPLTRNQLHAAPSEIPSNTTSLSPQLPGQSEPHFPFDLTSFNDNGGIEFDTQLDEAFGSFGQSRSSSSWHVSSVPKSGLQSVIPYAH
ncbi:uncharacterized protein Z518_05799 [Rhinocladiella mackenziei CBS 650.93]|uniref:Rhinocladiella mackenziei CBS 650.93 unplaced genomic scaffold supercont1.4, whole genome shotgun sequence n=1 Tax=Rhinocladiella mackenziei CBS 650.93 TaxID=1442369 RepID=A0A0D2H3D6_9EURO|nr:uncharacterized protein Z518_05799 [Rhinocladiella mackenziei CBS 650.93]KIX04928.1 hypothetical protein Z518_05799 [Rhinocladiella mackenziei CBS 650.93]